LSVTLWGVHGSVPKSGLLTSEYGCATSCYEVTYGSKSLICDAGTGLVALGQKLLQDETTEIDIALTHFHVDHVMGLPFFAPLFEKGVKIRFFADEKVLAYSVEEMMHQLFAQPFLPIDINAIQADLSFHDLSEAAVHNVGDATIECLELCHPGGNTAFRISHKGKNIVYSGDFSHRDADQMSELTAWVNNADLGIVETTFTPQNYEPHKSFGHTHWRAAGEIAADAKMWLGVHHHHLNDDHTLGLADQDLRATIPNGRLGKDGQTFWL
jgi:phosphoribosyl 1,2-cyclic phosphodiesterase